MVGIRQCSPNIVLEQASCSPVVNVNVIDLLHARMITTICTRPRELHTGVFLQLVPHYLGA